MKINTKYFGEIDYAPEECITFSRGLYGFEEERSFLLLPFAEDGGLYSLQSVTTPPLSFVVMNPFSLSPSYAPILQGEELEELGVADSHDLCYFVLCALKKPTANSTVNLKCPVVVNEDTRQAMQVILEGQYEMRHLLSSFESEEGEPC